jgi:hypothetical protein
MNTDSAGQTAAWNPLAASHLLVSDPSRYEIPAQALSDLCPSVSICG